jgi:predicted nuclease of predicted toxin-antitoxin system
MAKYLIDVNLPYYFALWNNENFFHQKDIDDEAKDDEIWKFATENNLTIITKDSDFSNKILFHEPPPRVIHIKFGNLKMKEFFSTVSNFWEDIVKMSKTHKLVNVFNDRIEGIN